MGSNPTPSANLLQYPNPGRGNGLRHHQVQVRVLSGAPDISRSSNAKDTELRTPECGLDSCTVYHDSLVQQEGYRTFNPGDVGSNPTGITITIEYLLMLLIHLDAEGLTTCRGAMEFSVSIPRDTLGEELLHASDDMRGGGNRQLKSRGTV